MSRLPILAIAVVVCCGCRDAITPSPSSIVADVAAGPSGYEVVDLGSFGGISTLGAGLNDRGQVAGSASVPSGADHAFVWQDGVLQDLGFLDGTIAAEAEAINARGQIAGSMIESCGEFACNQVVRLFLWDSGSLRQLDPPDGPGHGGTQVVRLTDAGDLVAEVDYSPSATRGVVWRAGVPQDLGGFSPTQIRTFPNAMNARGQVVGASTVDRPEGGIHLHPFLWENGRLQDLGVPFERPCRGDPTVNCASARALGINARGEVLGVAVNSAGLSRALVWQDAAVRELDVYPDRTILPIAINDRGQVAGTAVFPAVAFLWDHGVVQELGSLGKGDTQISALGDAGEVVGWSLTASGERHAFVWQDGEMTDLGPGDADGRGSQAEVINHRGDVLGFALDSQFHTHAILWRKVGG